MCPKTNKLSLIEILAILVVDSEEYSHHLIKEKIPDEVFESLLERGFIEEYRDDWLDYRDRPSDKGLNYITDLVKKGLK